MIMLIYSWEWAADWWVKSEKHDENLVRSFAVTPWIIHVGHTIRRCLSFSFLHTLWIIIEGWWLSRLILHHFEVHWLRNTFLIESLEEVHCNLHQHHANKYNRYAQYKNSKLVHEGAIHQRKLLQKCPLSTIGKTNCVLTNLHSQIGHLVSLECDNKAHDWQKDHGGHGSYPQNRIHKVLTAIDFQNVADEQASQDGKQHDKVHEPAGYQPCLHKSSNYVETAVVLLDGIDHLLLHLL